MNTKEKKNYPITMSMDKDLVAKIDAMAVKCGMSRSEFIATFMEITLDSQIPVINFGIELGRIARVIWPKSKLKSA